MRHLSPVPDDRARHLHAVARIEALCDELSGFYPEIIELARLKSSGTARGRDRGFATPVRLDVLEFLTGHYPDPTAPADEFGQVDAEYQLPGFVETILGLDKSAHLALRITPTTRLRPAGYDGLGEDDRVLDALTWLRRAADSIVADAGIFAETLDAELSRLKGRCAGMLYGGKFDSSSWSTCEHCGNETVVSDDTRAFCADSDCRTAAGGRHCWAWQASLVPGIGEWVAIEEPNGNRDAARRKALGVNDDSITRIAAAQRITYSA